VLCAYVIINVKRSPEAIRYTLGSEKVRLLAEAY